MSEIVKYIKRHFLIDVKLDDNLTLLTLYNIEVSNLLQDLVNVWYIKNITKFFFTKIEKNALVLDYFYIPDLFYSISKILELKKGRKSIKYELINILKILKTKTWYKDYFLEHPSRLDYDKLKELKYTLLPVQLNAVKAYDLKTQALDLKGLLLSAATGSGKSVLAIAIVNCLKPSAIIVICPKSLIDDVWVDAINVQFNNTKKIWKANLNIPITDKYDYYIFNYEALGKAVVFFGRNHFNKIAIVADESHNLNNVDALRTRQFLLLCKLTKSNDIIFSTGTPISGEAKELRTVFRAIDPLFTPSAENKFNSIFTKSSDKVLEIVKNRLGMESAGITIEEVMKNAKPIIKDIKIKIPNSKIYTLDYIKKEFNQYMVDKTKEYQRDMPKYEKIYGTGVAIYKGTINTSKEAYDLSIYIEYIREIRAGYNAKNMGFMSSYCNTFENKSIIPKLPNDLKKGFKEAASIVKYYKLYILGKWLGDGLGRRKIQLHKEMIQYSGIDKIVNDSIKKTICFTSYVEVLLAANKYFVDREFKPLLIYSDTSKEVGNILKTFKTSDENSILLASISMLNAGATLTVANTIIFLNLPPRSKEYQQAYARAFRLGQDTQVYVYNLILDTGGVPNISTRMADTVTWSKLQMQKITGTQTKLSRVIDEETFMSNLLTYYTPEEDHVSLFNKIINLFSFD